jgi:hypothetical protein
MAIILVGFRKWYIMITYVCVFSTKDFTVIHNLIVCLYVCMCMCVSVYVFMCLCVYVCMCVSVPSS